MFHDPSTGVKNQPENSVHYGFFTLRRGAAESSTTAISWQTPGALPPRWRI
jgi:hypothetical protein